MFTVVIPAFNRPELLRNALSSVSQQTAKHLIDCVIVSENGLNKESELVCREFSELDITYLYQDKQIPVLEHLKFVLSQANEGYTAMLCDDDWWDIHHLDLAHQALAANNNCIAYFSNYTYAQDTYSLRGDKNYWGQAMHYGKNKFLNFSINIYDAEDVMTLCLLVTPFHFSSMVCNAEILKEAVSVFDEVHPAVADRLLWAKLSTYGDVIFNPLTTSIILQHPKQDSHNYSNQWQEELQKGAIRTFELASSQGIDIQKRINCVYKSSSADDMFFIAKSINENFYEIDKIRWFYGYGDVVSLRYKRELDKTDQNSTSRKVYRKFKNVLKNIID